MSVPIDSAGVVRWTYIAAIERGESRMDAFLEALAGFRDLHPELPYDEARENVAEFLDRLDRRVER